MAVLCTCVYIPSGVYGRDSGCHYLAHLADKRRGRLLPRWNRVRGQVQWRSRDGLDYTGQDHLKFSDSALA